MYEKVDCRHQSDAVDPAGCGASPAAFITIPRLALPVDLHSQGDPSRLIPILHGIGHYVDLEPLMKNDCSPLSVLKKALRRWFSEMLSEAVDKLTDFEVDFFTESQLQNHPPFEFDTEPGDYVLLFQLGSPDVEDFSVGKTIVRYEKEFPGLGQKILRKINDATPFDIGTPEHFLDVVRDNCWNGYSSDQEYLEEICAFEEEEERENVLEMYRDEIWITWDDFRNNFEPWMLAPDKTAYQGVLPPELQALFDLPERKYRHIAYPSDTVILPGILIWNSQMIFECFDYIYNQAAYEGADIILNGLYWKIPKDAARLPEVLEEINHAVSSLGRLLRILNQIHMEEEDGSDDAE